MIALALLSMLASCGSSTKNTGVRCIQQASDGGCFTDLHCGETKCPAGETLMLDLDAGTCFDEKAGCF
jgi:hypothetical protein